jgi:thiamine-phosphate pyrophosphorylase
VPLQRSQVPSIYAITAEDAGPRLVELVGELAAAGIRWIQLREKSGSDRQRWMRASAVRRSAGEEVVVFVNDRPDIAAAAGCQGVHLGDEDLPPSAVIRFAPPGLLVGYSTHSLAEAEAAAADPAVDYVAIGPIFSSPTKNVRPPLGLKAIEQVRSITDKPLIAIGGIDATNIAAVLAAGADSAAVISALYAGPSISGNVRRLIDAGGIRQ